MYSTPQGGDLPEPGPVPQLRLESVHTHTSWVWVPEACKAEGVREGPQEDLGDLGGGGEIRFCRYTHQNAHPFPTPSASG